MRIKFNFFQKLKCLDPKGHAEELVIGPIPSFPTINICEEYASAFRTESYSQFWARVMQLTIAKGKEDCPSDPAGNTKHASSAARLPSYRLLVETLLDPDQDTAARVLAAHARAEPWGRTDQALLADYFAETANASVVCALLLSDIDRVRTRYRHLRAALHAPSATTNTNNTSNDDSLLLAAVLQHLGDLPDVAVGANPFGPLVASQREFLAAQAGAASLLGRLERGRGKARARLRVAARVRRVGALLLVALAASAPVAWACVALHAIAALAAAPLLVPLLRWVSAGRLARAAARMDAAAKGAYILNRDLDTISRLLARLRDEVEHMLAMLRFCAAVEAGGGSSDRNMRLSREVVRQLTKTDARFTGQLDELEEHLYLCFVTINKARNLVLNQISTGRPPHLVRACNL